MRGARDMKKNLKKWRKSALFTAGGALAGLAYYNLIGCVSGSCPLTSHPLAAMAYMGLAGWLLSVACGKERGDECGI